MLGTLRRYVIRKKAARIAAERAEKLAAFQQALKRGDTRRQHGCFEAAKAATLKALKVGA